MAGPSEGGNGSGKVPASQTGQRCGGVVLFAPGGSRSSCLLWGGRCVRRGRLRTCGTIREVSPRALRLAKKELRTDKAEFFRPQMPECDYDAGFHSGRYKFRSDLVLQPFR